MFKINKKHVLDKSVGL